MTKLKTYKKDKKGREPEQNKNINPGKYQQGNSRSEGRNHQRVNKRGVIKYW